MVASAMPRKKADAKRRSFNLSNDLYGKLQRVAHRERINATQQLERTLDRFFAEYEREHGIKIDDIELPVDDEQKLEAGVKVAVSSPEQELPVEAESAIKAESKPLEAPTTVVKLEVKNETEPN